MTTLTPVLSRNWDRPDSYTLDAYRENGGYEALRKALTMEPDAIVEMVKASGLRGRGGAGFPTGMKWGFLPKDNPKPRYLVVNADESEPGTCKDIPLMMANPHVLVEGIIISAYAIRSHHAFIYVRGEVLHVIRRLQQAVAEAYQAGYLGKDILGTGYDLDVVVHTGAGAYICGEESAMIESIEGKRGLPRHRPPYIAEVGLFGRPTLNHNVETLVWIPEILSRGVDWFTAQGRRGHRGLRSFSVSGRVREPGVKVAPAGITARELIDEFCGGMAEGHEFVAYLPGGASGGILPAALADVPLDFGVLDTHGAFVGSHAVIVLSDKDDLRAVALNLMRFFRAESCSQCTPCRAGTDKMVRLMEAGDWDRSLMEDLCTAMRDASICGLGQAAPNPVRSILNFFDGAAGAAR